MKKLLLITVLFFFCGCSQSDRITQTSTIDALLAGAYDGQIECGKLLSSGDFGIGTFDRLDGEMAVLDGKVYQIKADGKVYRPAGNVKTPFATVCKFKPDTRFEIKWADFKTAESIINEKILNQNIFAAVKITGTFKYMKTRSVPAQNKPYPPLVEVAKNQPVFEMNEVRGTIVGFRSPPFVKGVNVSGFHFHFLSNDFTRGGHVLDFQLDAGKCEIDVCNELLLILPEDDILKDIDLSEDKSEELQKVEK